MEKTFMISQLMIQLSNMMKLEKISTGQGVDYTTGCLLDFAYFGKNYKLIALIFTGKIKETRDNTRLVIYYILEQSKETKLEFSKATTKVL